MLSKTDEVSEAASVRSADADSKRYSLDDLWRMADEEGAPVGIMSFEAMNAAKVRKQP